MPTPATSARRRSILKVRFDVESSVENTSAEGTFQHIASAHPSDQAGGTEAQHPVVETKSYPVANGHVAEQSTDNETERPSTPPTITLRTARKSPGVRLVDAFGREADSEDHSSGQKTDTPPERPSTPPGRNPPPAPVTPRSQSAVKIVDAMGRELQDGVEEPPSFMRSPLTHRDALARLQRVADDIAGEISEIDRSSDELGFQGKLLELEEASRAARTTRQKILESLELVRKAGDGSKSRYKTLRRSLGRSKLLSPIFTEHRWSLNFNSYTFWGFLVVQIMILLIFYRISVIRAKHDFLTTYYDPFFPDLYLHVTKPDTTCHSIPSRCLPVTAERAAWTRSLADLWANLSCTVSRWQRLTWDLWTSGSPKPQGTMWPPT